MSQNSTLGVAHGIVPIAMAECTCEENNTCSEVAHRRGRTARTRQTKIRDARPISLAHNDLYVRLFRWLKGEYGCRFKHLASADFRETGRGLMTKISIHPGDTLLSLPQEALITVDTVLSSTVGKYIKRYKDKLTAHEALCVFLMYERYLGAESKWAPYINVLPTSFTTAVYFTKYELSFLPPSALTKANRQVEKCTESFQNIINFVISCWMEMDGVFTWEELRWSWCVVNTRSVYLELTPCIYLRGQDTCLALAPALDLVNHSPSAQVKAGLNKKNGCYEIITFDRYNPHDQVFILYGAHDNTKLFTEYGFTIPHNPNNVYEFSEDEIKVMVKEFDIRNMSQKSLCVQEAKLKCLTAAEDGLSWTLLTFLRILAMTWPELKHWQLVLRGEPVSAENEAVVDQMSAWLVKRAVNVLAALIQKEHDTMTMHEKLAMSLCWDEWHILQICQRLHRT